MILFLFGIGALLYFCCIEISYIFIVLNFVCCQITLAEAIITCISRANYICLNWKLEAPGRKH